MPLAGLIFPVFLPKFPFSEPSVYSFSICRMIERQRMRQESITELYRGGKNSHYTPLLIKTTDLLGFPITSLNFYLKETLSTPFFQLFFFLPWPRGRPWMWPHVFLLAFRGSEVPIFLPGLALWGRRFHTSVSSWLPALAPGTHRQPLHGCTFPKIQALAWVCGY